MSEQQAPIPHYPDDQISTRTWVEQRFADLSKLISQKSEDREKLAARRWDDHDALHAAERERVDGALRAETSLRAADVTRIQTILDLREAEKIQQAREYERRLEDLNHEQARIQARNAEYVRNEAHAAEIRRLDDKIGNNTTHVIDIERTVSVVEVRLAALTSSLLWMTRLLVGAVLTGLVGVGIAVLTRSGS